MGGYRRKQPQLGTLRNTTYSTSHVHEFAERFVQNNACINQGSTQVSDQSRSLYMDLNMFSFFLPRPTFQNSHRHLNFLIGISIRNAYVSRSSVISITSAPQKLKYEMKTSIQRLFPKCFDLCLFGVSRPIESNRITSTLSVFELGVLPLQHSPCGSS